MSKSSPVHAIRLPLRKICSAIPALAMISGGIILSASAAPTVDIRSGPVSNSSPAVVVPDIALTLPTTAQIVDDLSPLKAPNTAAPEAPAPNALVSMLPAGTVPGSSSLVTLDSTGIPVRALEGYRLAASLTNSSDPACHIDWALVAAIGRVESDHARFGGNQLDSAGVAQPGIIGIALDGSNGTARITDTDGGLLDRDTTYDRAVGPMQFIPSTWRVSGVDADGDGVKNPQDIADAATATAVYLCSGPGDLSRAGDLYAAIMRYNASDSYVRTVTAIASAYRQGVTALPASDLPAANSAPSASALTTTAPTSVAPPSALTTTAPTSAALTTTATTTTATTTTATTAAPTTAAPTTAAAPTTTATTTTPPADASPSTSLTP